MGDHALNKLSLADAQIAALICAHIDFTTEIAEETGTSVVVPASDMRAVLDYVEMLVEHFTATATDEE